MEALVSPLFKSLETFQIREGPGPGLCVNELPQLNVKGSLGDGQLLPSFQILFIKNHFFSFIKTSTYGQLYRSGKMLTIYGTLNEFQYFTSSNFS